MFNSLWVAKTGMEAQDFRVQTIAQNMANASTTGFKKDLAHFSSLDYSVVRGAGGTTETGKRGGELLQVGQGVKVSDTSKVFTQGSIKQTDVNTDIFIGGEGFFALEGDAGGDPLFTRDGHFKLDRITGTNNYHLVHVASRRALLGDGGLATTTIAQTHPQLTAAAAAPGPLVITGGQIVQSGAHLNDIHIEANGMVWEDDGTGSPNASSLKGWISVARFGANSGLAPESGNLFRDQPQHTGGALYSSPDENGFGDLRQGALEVSNVTTIDEMVDMIEAQRGYEMGSKVLEKTDEMMSTLIQRT